MKRYCIFLILILIFDLSYAEEARVSFALVGDIMYGTDYPEPNLPDNNGKELIFILLCDWIFEES